MWCSYNDTFCLNPLCLTGCVSLENRRRHEERAVEILVKALQVAAQVKDKTNNPEEQEGK